MPLYSYWCDNCNKRFEVSKSMDLSGRTETCECGNKGRRIIDIPAYHGLESGPGCGSNEMVFSRPDPQKDIPLTLKKMEEAGRLNTPELRAAAQIKYDEAKNIISGGIDYDKVGHVLDD